MDMIMNENNQLENETSILTIHTKTFVDGTSLRLLYTCRIVIHINVQLIILFRIIDSTYLIL
jgi:hypothetical protein